MACNDAEYLNPGARPPFAAEQKENVTRVELAKGAVTVSHRHEAEVMVIVVSGAWRFYLPNRVVTLGPNQVLRIPAGTEHRAQALADTVALNVSSAPRDRNCCSAFLPPRQAEPGPAEDPQHDPDQYLWGV